MESTPMTIKASLSRKIDVSVVNKSNNLLPKYETPSSAGMDIRADLVNTRNTN